MSTKLTVAHKFDQPVDAVFAMYSDRAFFEKKYQALGYTNVEIVDFKSSPSGVSITARYDTKNEAPLPDFAKKFVGSTISITQTDSWDAKSRTGKLSFDIKGMPVKVNADMKLVPQGAGSTNQMAFVLSCGIPLLGGKLESLIADDIRGKAGKDEATSQKLLAERAK